MRDIMMWIYAVLMFLVTESRSEEPGNNQFPSMNYTTNDTRDAAYNLGHDITLTCSDKTWNESLFIIWTIKLKHKVCKLAFSINGEASEDTCDDGKSLRNTSTSQSYLHVPNFSVEDVGIYQCEQAYRAGVDARRFKVAITAPPNLSSWLEVRDNTMVAVCKAASGKPAANISWSHPGNNSTYVTQMDSDGFITVESHLMLTEDMDKENLTCIISHLFWTDSKTLKPKLERTNMATFLLWMIPVVVVVIAFLVGIAIFAPKKLLMLRRCQQSDGSQSKAPPIEDVEEVEPYASYVQRVNSIYN